MTVIPISSVPAARQYLINAFTAAVAGTTPATEIFDGDPDHEDNLNWVTVGGARRQVEPLALVGNGGQFWRQERYTVEIEINCFVAGRSMQQVQTNAYGVLALLETAVRSDPSLGGLVLEATPKESTSIPQWSEDSMGSICMITTTVEVFNTL